MGVEIFDFVLQGNLDRDLVNNVLLGSIDDSDIAQFEVNLLIVQHPLSTSPLIHDVYFSDDTNGPLTVLVPLSGKLQSIRC